MSHDTTKYPFAWGTSSKEASYFFYLTTENKVGNENFENLYDFSSIILISSSHWILRRGEIRTGQVTTVMDNVRMVFNSPASWGSAATYIFAESVSNSPNLFIL